MADNLNISVLCAAKEEYTNQLKHYLTPLIQEGFVSIYDDARENDEENVLRQFQIYLKQIPRWNQTILEQETKRIKDRCPFLMDLVTAIFVSHVKILASVRLGGNHGNIKIKIPTSDIFIHSIYVNAAEKIYYEPQPFRDLLNRKNVEVVKDIIDETVEDTISSMIPIQSILQEYLSSAFSEHTKPDPQPDPPPEAPYERQITGTDIVNDAASHDSAPIDRSGFHAPVDQSNFAASTANEVSDFGTMHNHFSIGDTAQPYPSTQIVDTAQPYPSTPNAVRAQTSFASVDTAQPYPSTATTFAPTESPPEPEAKFDLGEMLDATSTGSPSDVPMVEDTSFGSAFSSDFGEPGGIKSIPISVAKSHRAGHSNPFESNPHMDSTPVDPQFDPSSDQSFFYNDDVAILE